MNRLLVYIEEAVRIIQMYRGEVPFTLYLKQYLARDRRKGSRDRKLISELCYNYFRIGHLLSDKPIEEKLRSALFLTQQEKSLLTSLLSPELEARLLLNIEEKLDFLNIELSIPSLFPFSDLLSQGIEISSFQKSFFKQPFVFIRIRPGYRSIVAKKLQQSGFSYEFINDTCVSLASGSKLESMFEINKEIIVQDASSQQIIPFLSGVFPENKSISVWDCCAASGGKSIHLHDLFLQSNLTVSDIRASILKNLEYRFKEAGIRDYTSTVIDLSQPLQPVKEYDLIVADVPCSGSGTWRRTPEQLQFFKEYDLHGYVSLQRKVVTNLLPALKTGGYLLYSTCSAFAAENEGQRIWMEQTCNLHCLKSQLLDNTAIGADTMYVSLLQKK